MTIRLPVCAATLLGALGGLVPLTAAAPLASLSGNASRPGNPWGDSLPPLQALPPLPEPRGPQRATVRPATPIAGASRGQVLRLQGLEQRAAWEGGGQAGSSLWLPLEVLQGQLGVSSRSLSDGALSLEWYGRRLLVPADQQRSLGDEIAVDAAPLLDGLGVQRQIRGTVLELDLPSPRLLAVRQGELGGRQRVVLDLNGPALVRQEPDSLRLALHSDPTSRAQLAALGLAPRPGEDLILASQGLHRVFTLGDPVRVVLERAGGSPGTTSTEADSGQPPLDPRLAPLLGRHLQWERQLLTAGGSTVLLTAVRLDPRTSPLELRPLYRPGGMEGLSSLTQLARQGDALVAVNGGYFNRVRRLPLGALKEQGRWLSGPILNRGAMGWEARHLPRFGQLRLEEGLIGADGHRWPLLTVNSGYVQRGLARYTSDWGVYRALSDGESGLLLRDGQVQELLGAASLANGVPIRTGEQLVVARGGVPLPWGSGERLQLTSHSSDPLGNASHVIGGGPLLLQGGRLVLNGSAEGFSPSFLQQGAPRTVVGSDGQRLWLLTLEGRGGSAGPTLGETAVLLRQLGLQDALNLDGGSSTGLVMGGQHTVKGRGVAGSVHHGLGLVPGEGSAALAGGGSPGS